MTAPSPARVPAHSFGHRAPGFFYEQNQQWHDELTGYIPAREEIARPKGNPRCVSKRYAADATTDGVQGRECCNHWEK
jgi:hypothetical protein